MTSSTITTHNPSEDLKAIRNLGQQTQVNGGSTSKATNSPEAVATSSEEIDTSQKYDNEAGESDNSTRSPDHIDSNTSLPVPDNSSTVSTEMNKLDDDEEEEGGEEEEESEDDFPVFKGGEPRGRVVNPIAGSRPVRPIRR